MFMRLLYSAFCLQDVFIGFLYSGFCLQGVFMGCLYYSTGQFPYTEFTK